MDTTLILGAGDLEGQELQALTRELAANLNRETDARAILPEGAGPLGARGDAALIGQIVLTVMSTGTAAALLGVLKAFFERRPSLRVAIRRPDGSELEITASGLERQRLDQTVVMAREFLQGA